MDKPKTRFLIICLFFLVFLCGSLAVNAQEQNDEFTLPDVTVTAEKREVDVQSTAMSVTAVSGADIRDMAQSTLELVLRDIASVEVAYANRGGQINIRGIGSYVDTNLADPAVAVIEDNIYNGNSLATFSNMYDIDRVEVLRGPQGTLYGRNASGGTINVISQNPRHEFQLTGNLQIGDYNLFHFDGAVNFPLSDKWAARIAVLRETRDGYLSSGDMDSDVSGGRVKLLWEPSDTFSVLATYEYFEENDHGTNTVPIPGSAGNLPLLGPPASFGYTKPDEDRDGVADDFLMLDENGDLVPGSDGIADIVQTGWVVPEGADPWTNDEWHPGGFLYAEKKAYSLQVDWDMGWGLLTAIPSFAESYNHNRDDHLAGISRSPGYEYTQNQQNSREQTSAEVRITSPAESDWSWIVGVYYMESDNVGGFPEQDPTTYYDNRYHTAFTRNPIESTALFGQTTIPVTDRFRVTGGIRAANDKEDREYRIGLSTPEGDVLYDTGWLTYNSDVSSTTYKAGIEFDMLENSMLYAQVATGFKQGGMNFSAPPTTFEPEDLTAYQVGLKNRFLDNRMQLNFEFFYYKYDQMQAQMPMMAPIGDTGEMDFIMGIVNAEEGTLQGVDFELDYLVTMNDRLSVSGSFLDSEIGEFFLPPNPFGNPEPFDMTGRQMSSSPEWAFTLAYEHTWELDNGATVTGRIDSKISDGYYRTLEQWQPYAWEDGYTRSNANLTYRSGDGRWSVSAWARNLENDAQYTWSVPFYRGMVKAPRTFGVNASFRY